MRWMPWGSQVRGGMGYRGQTTGGMRCWCSGRAWKPVGRQRPYGNQVTGGIWLMVCMEGRRAALKDGRLEALVPVGSRNWAARWCRRMGSGA